jgi:hypothetical protein
VLGGLAGPMVAWFIAAIIYFGCRISVESGQGVT